LQHYIGTHQLHQYTSNKTPNDFKELNDLFFQNENARCGKIMPFGMGRPQHKLIKA
jgi:hypothetical protein